MRSSAPLVFALLALTGCTAGKAFIASARDYEAYRETRVGKNVAARLEADVRYLKERPSGAYRDEVKADVGDKEPGFYAARASTVSGLEAYLDLFPDGPHAGDARIALTSLRSHKEAPDALARAAEETRRRLEANARSRTAALAEVTRWFDGLMSPESFRAPLSSGPKELVVPFSLGLPAPRCEIVEPQESGVARRCKKQVAADFVVPWQKSFQDRELLYDVTLELDARDVPLRAVLAGPDLFERIEETYVEDAPVEDEAALRAVSVDRVVGIVTSAFEGHVSTDPACSQRVPRSAGEVGPRDVARFSCKGLRVTVTTGGEPGADDIIRFEPAP